MSLKRTKTKTKEFKVNMWNFIEAFLLYLDLGSLVLEPELDLQGIQSELSAQLSPLFVVWVRTLLKETDKTTVKNIRNI